VNPATDAIERVKQADWRALRAQLAFAVGKWDEYWQAEGDAAAKRIEEAYGNATTNALATSG
jgi:hypothetical protein